MPGKIKKEIMTNKIRKSYLKSFFYRFLLFWFICDHNTTSFSGEYDHELKRFDFEIEYKAIQQIHKEMNLDDFVETLKLSGPIYPVLLTPHQVKLKIEDALQGEIKQHYNPIRYDEIKNEAEEKYRMYKIGDKVSIQRQYGSQVIEVNGLLEAISSDMVKISGLPIPTVDVQREDLARLYWTNHENAVAKQIRNKTRKFEDERSKFATLARARISKRIWTENGYRKLKKSGRWVSVMDFVLHKYEKAREKKIKRLREIIRKQTYEDNEYIFVQERGSWIPKQVLIAEAKAEEEKNRSFLDKVKLFFRKKDDDKESDLTPKPTKVVKKDTTKKTEEKLTEQEEEVDEKNTFQEEEDLWDEELEEDVSDTEAKPGSEQVKTRENEKSDDSEEEEDVSDLFDEDFE